LTHPHISTSGGFNTPQGPPIAGERHWEHQVRLAMERERLIDAIKVKTLGLIHGISNDFFSHVLSIWGSYPFFQWMIGHVYNGA